MFAASVGAACGAAPALATEQQQPSYACGGGEIGHGTVSRIVDGRIFVLEDGREVRLAAIEVPPAAPTQHVSYAPDGNTTAAALTALASGDQVILRSAEIASDRYGRLVAYAYTMRDGDALFVQGELIADGFARVGDRAGHDCAGELLSREKGRPKGKAWPLGRSVL
jgi:endonuclease YncB( thermonuclease family)